MKFINAVGRFLHITVTPPQIFGWVHIVMLLGVIGITAFMCLKLQNVKDKTFRVICAVMWGVMLFFEIVKQFQYNTSLTDGVLKWNDQYAWHGFPFQLCSTPLFTMPIIAFVKDCKFRDSVIAFTATFAMFGGLVTILYPAQVFHVSLWINFQTIIHHSFQVIFGIYSIAYFRKRWNFKYFLSGIWTFVVMMGVAMLLNWAFYPLTKGAYLSLFYISPYYPCTLPLVSMIYPVVPYIVFLLIYFVGFTLASMIIHWVAVGVMKLNEKITTKRNANKNATE